jgi:murein L,D-transpeptidase YcbB/YkuD
MQMRLEILGDDEKFKGVVKVRVPGIYPKGKPLPARMAKLVREAAEALQKVYEQVSAEGGHLYISDMLRSATMQQKAHEDWKSGRKSSYSPPACSSVHESGRAIDIDAYDTGIGHKRVREILNANGWTNIVQTLTGKECWHYEFRDEKWEEYRKKYGYKAMARAMKEEIGNLAGLKQAKREEKGMKWVQEALNKVMGTRLVIDGVFGAKTKAVVMRFQKKYGLQVDGIPGPMTKAKLKEVLEEKKKQEAIKAKEKKKKEEVKWLQKALNKLINAKLVVDGDYGPKTKAAVKEFQRRYGLVVDGIAGPKTKAKIRRLVR